MKYLIVLILLLYPLNPNFPNGKEELYKPFAQVMPEPKDGIQGIYAKIEYPPMAQKLGIQGKVYLLVYVNEDGKVEEVKVIKGLGGGCDEAAVDAIKSSDFSPGKDNGVPIKVKLSLPIKFELK